MNIINTPSLLSFEENPNKLVLRPSQNLGLVTNRGRIDVAFLATAGGEKFYIEGVEFTTSLVIDDVDKILVLPNVLDTNAVINTAKTFLSAFNNNPVLNSKWAAVRIGGIVRITSLTDGPKGNLTFSVPMPQAVNFTNSFPAQVDYESDAFKNYGYRLDIFSTPFNFPFSSPGVETKVVSLNQSVSSVVDNVDVEFDVNPHCQAARFMPVFAGYFLGKLSRFKAYVYETYLNEFNVPVENLLHSVSPWFVTMGGTSHIEALTLDMNGYWNEPSKFLTNLKKRKSVYGSDKDQTEFLSFVYAHQWGFTDYSLRLKVKVRFEDGTSQTFYKDYVTVDTVDNNGVQVWDVSASFLGLPQKEDDAGKAIQWWEVNVVKSTLTLNTNVTEVVRYEALRDCSRDKKQVLFINNEGGWETFMFTGVNNLSVLTSQERFSKNLKWDDGDSVFDNAVKENSLTNSATLNSRYLNRNEMLWAKNILKSPLLYLVEGTSLTPVILTKADWSWNGVDELYVLNLDVSYSHKDRPIGG